MDCESLTPTRGATQKSVVCESLTPTRGARQQSVDCESLTSTRGATQESLDCESLTPIRGATQQSLNCESVTPTRGAKQQSVECESLTPTRGAKQQSVECESLTPTREATQQSVDSNIVPVSSIAPEGWGPKEGGNATSPLHSPGSPKRGRNQKSKPMLGVTMMHQATKRIFKDCPGFLNSIGRLGPKRGRKCYVTPAFSGVSTKGDEIRSQNLCRGSP